MGKKYKTNYRLILTVIVTVCVAIIIFYIWQRGILGGIIAALFCIGMVILSLLQVKIKSVTLDTSAIIIEYKKETVIIPYEDCVKIEHYIHGPLTERVFIYANNHNKYEITFDLTGFRDMCSRLYSELLKINKEQIADEWFQKEFGGSIS